MKSIMKAAQKSKNWMLAGLAVRVRLDTFTKVKEAMDKMKGELQAQQKEEYDKNAFCVKEIDETEDSIKVETNTQTDLGDANTELSNTIATLTKEIAELKQEVADMEIALKQAGEGRKGENKVYQQAVSDQRATIAVLNMAMSRLKEFYGFVQVPGAASSYAPEKPKAHTNNSNGGGVIQMIAKIILEAEVAEQDLVFDENNSQEDYATFTSDTTVSIEADRQSIAQKEEQLAASQSELSDTKASQLANEAQLTKLKELLSARHGECDYVMKYFDIRQTARKEEMDAIDEAKAILSGANFGL